jgi:hypothetical protein
MGIPFLLGGRECGDPGQSSVGNWLSTHGLNQGARGQVMTEKTALPDPPWVADCVATRGGSPEGFCRVC